VYKIAEKVFIKIISRNFIDWKRKKE